MTMKDETKKIHKGLTDRQNQGVQVDALVRRRPLRVLSMGAGVQSSTLALMCAHGEFEMPDCAIFADTGAEPQYVYKHLDWLEMVLPFPVYRVKRNKGLKYIIKNSLLQKRCVSVPFYTESQNGNGGMLRRQCTREFKVEPITKKIRELSGLKKGQRAPKGKILATQYIGISFDELTRMKDAREKWIKNQWPLVDRRMKRIDCIRWLEEKDYPVPGKSACTFCPYHDNTTWRDMKLNDPKSWQEAVDIDRLIRNGVRGTKERLYLHSSLKPLEEIDFRSMEDLGQLNMFDNECEGMCGV